jgi:hypothetical protein
MYSHPRYETEVNAQLHSRLPTPQYVLDRRSVGPYSCGKSVSVHEDARNAFRNRKTRSLDIA